MTYEDFHPYSRKAWLLSRGGARFRFPHRSTPCGGISYQFFPIREQHEHHSWCNHREIWSIYYLGNSQFLSRKYAKYVLFNVIRQHPLLFDKFFISKQFCWVLCPGRFSYLATDRLYWERKYSRCRIRYIQDHYRGHSYGNIENLFCNSVKAS